MFSRKSMVIATIFIAFMYLVFVPLVSAATEYKMADYWPFKEGSWWEFNDGKIEITGTEKINEINTFIYVDSGSCGGGEEELHFVNDDTNGFGIFSQSEDGRYSLVKLIKPYVKKGDTTTASSKDSDGKRETLVFKFEGTANVVVPAGKFKGCLRFSVKQKVVNKVENYYSYHTERFYLAKGVGLVKAVRVKESANSEDNIFAPCGFDVFNGIRELKDYSQAATGTYTASGTYTWNSTKGKITWNWTTTDFVCEGPELGTETKKGVTVTSTTMTWTIDDDMTWTRSSGTAGDIVGTWTASDSETGNSWTLTFNADGTMSATGNIVKCGDDEDDDSPSAQVVNNSGDSIYLVNVGHTLFTLTGRGNSGGSTGFSDVAEGTNTITVKQTSTSASVSVGSLGSFQKDTGYAVNIRKVSGSYCAELWQRLNADSSFNDDTTRVLISTTCGDGGGDDGGGSPFQITFHAKHFYSDGDYWLDMSISDPNHTATSVSVTGYGITGSFNLTYNSSPSSWNSDRATDTEVSFGTTHPQPPLTYTFTVTAPSGTQTYTDTVNCFLEEFVTNPSPIGTIVQLQTFSWTKINQTNIGYRVQLSSTANDASSDWNSDIFTDASSIAYTGQALSPGNYSYSIVAGPVNGNCESFRGGSFTVQ